MESIVHVLLPFNQDGSLLLATQHLNQLTIGSYIVRVFIKI